MKKDESLVQKLKEARSAFGEFESELRLEQSSFPDKLKKYLPELSFALDYSKQISEKEYEELTLRKGFESTYGLAKIVYRRGTETKLSDMKSDYYSFEQAYRVLDATILKYQKE
jgi:hypothetical protein